VQARVPEATLTIVGRDPGPDVLALSKAPHVTVVGNAPDIVPYLRNARVLAVPLETGGGTRLKILEAFAAGLPVVSTPIGCEGLAGVNGRELLIADRAQFADSICSILADPAGGEGLASRARAMVRNRYDWSIVGQQAREAVRSVVAHGRTKPHRGACP
jgi:glycosyltransferase involved in cell wall biosynthesis